MFLETQVRGAEPCQRGLPTPWLAPPRACTRSRPYPAGPAMVAWCTPGRLMVIVAEVEVVPGGGGSFRSTSPIVPIPYPRTPSSLDERIASALADAAAPLPFGELRSKCRVRATTLYERLAALTATGRIVKAGDRTFVRNALTRWKQGCEAAWLIPLSQFIVSRCTRLGYGHGHQIGCRVWPLSQHPARPSYAIRAFGSRSSRLLRL
jgi:hypothetical protein